MIKQMCFLLSTAVAIACGAGQTSSSAVNVVPVGFDRIVGFTLPLRADSAELIRQARTAYSFNTAYLIVKQDDGFDGMLSMLDSALDGCKANGVRAIVSFSDFPVFGRRGKLRTSAKVWGDTKGLDEAVAISRQIVDRYRSRGPELLGYHFINEPLVRDGRNSSVPTTWPALAQRLEKVVETDPNRWFFYQPGPGGLAKGYLKGQRPTGPRVAYSVNMYEPHAFTHQGIDGRASNLVYPETINGIRWDASRVKQTLTIAAEAGKRDGRPVVVTSFSAIIGAQGSEQYVSDVVAAARSLGIGWIYHTLGGATEWTPRPDACASAKPETAASPQCERVRTIERLMPLSENR
jgi:hypothetical protein